MVGNDKKRHLLKTFSWRVIATLITFLIAWTLTGNIDIAMGIGAIEVVLKMIAYYGHERFWFKKIRFQKEITRPPNLHPKLLGISQKERELILSQKAQVLWLTGLSGSGKSTIAEEIEKTLAKKGYKTFILDGDNTRWGINADLGFTSWDREENIRRVSEIAKLLSDAGFIVITSFISPYKRSREKAKDIIGEDRFKEIYISTSLGDCVRRDVKGLYKKAFAGEIKNFTGVSDPYEIPEAPFLEINSGDDGEENLKVSVDNIIENIEPYIKTKGAN